MPFVELKIPDFMNETSVESLKKIRENDYDYQKVEKLLEDATVKMLVKASKLVQESE